MYVWLDDERPAPDGWVHVRSVPLLMSLFPKVDVISLDHDLGKDELTGYDFLRWLEVQVGMGRVTRIPEIRLHTANPVGRKNMELVISSIRRLLPV